MANQRPMLAESISLNDLPKYVNNGDWHFQRKADGHRLLICVEDGQVSVLGRNGQAKVSGVSHKLLGQFEMFDKGIWTFDGELIGSQFVLFDLVHAGQYCDPSTPFVERYKVLETLYFEVWKPDQSVIGLLGVARTPDEKLKLARTTEDERGEGVMLRHVNGVYRTGRSAHLLKCKFTKEADCIIYDIDKDGHENVELVLLDPDGAYPQFPGYPEGVVPIGGASRIGKRPTPQKMDVWEVRFLYVVDRNKPRLYQPRLLRKRTDKEVHECLVSQLDHCYTDKTLTDKVRSEM